MRGGGKCDLKRSSEVFEHVRLSTYQGALNHTRVEECVCGIRSHAKGARVRVYSSAQRRALGCTLASV
jgi:hypothetical protein